MVFEIIATVIVVSVAAYLLYKEIKKSTSGKCNCGSCSSSCPKYKIEHKGK